MRGHPPELYGISKPSPRELLGCTIGKRNAGWGDSFARKGKRWSEVVLSITASGLMARGIMNPMACILAVHYGGDVLSALA